MKQFVTIMILMSNLAFVFGQLPNDISKTKDKLPDRIKKVQQYQNDVLLNVREYDISKNLKFSHYKQSDIQGERYLTMISGYVYDDSGKVLKTYYLHSNLGLSITYHEYDSSGNNIKLYGKNNNHERNESLIDRNPYAYISDIKNFDELVNHPKIMEIELEAKEYLMTEQTFDSLGNKLIQVFYNEKGDSIGFQKDEYDKNNNVVYSNFGDNNELYNEYIGNLLVQSVRMDYDKRENRKRILDFITFNTYDIDDRLVESVTYRKGNISNKFTCEYNDLDQKTKMFLHSNSNEYTYFYNEEGYVIEETFRAGKTEKVTKYNYEYEYYSDEEFAQYDLNPVEDTNTVAEKLYEKVRTAYQSSSTTDLDKFFKEWNKSGLPNTTEFMKQNNIIEEIYEIYKGFYNPFEIEYNQSKLNNKKYAVIQNQISYCVVDEISLEPEAHEQSCERGTINDFRPPLHIAKDKVLYMLPEYKMALNKFLGVKPDQHERNTDNLKELFNRIGFIHSYIDVNSSWGYVRLHTNPVVDLIVLDAEKVTAKVVFFKDHWGGEAILKKEGNAWKIVDVKMTMHFTI